MKKNLMIATAVAALALPSLSSRVFAAPPEQANEHHKFSEEDRAAFTDARIAALKAGLKLSPAQEKNWPAVETALRDAAKARAARGAEWREKAKELHEKRDAIEALRLASKGLSARGAELGKIADAAKPLFDSLDDAQKRRFGILLHAISRPQGHHWGMRHDRHSDEHGDVEHEE